VRSPVGVLERVREEEAVEEAREDSEAAHEHEQPELTRLACDFTHVKDTISNQLGRSLTQLAAELKDNDTLGRLFTGVPGRARKPPGMKPDSVIPSRKRVVK